MRLKWVRASARFLCVRRLAECDASLLLKEEPSSPPGGGFLKKILNQKRLVQNYAERSPNFGISTAVEFLPYRPWKSPQTAHSAATPGPQAENYGRGRKKNATMQGCSGKGLQCCNLHYGRDQNQYLPFFLVTMLRILFFASFTVRREIPLCCAALNTSSAMVS